MREPSKKPKLAKESFPVRFSGAQRERIQRAADLLTLRQGVQVYSADVVRDGAMARADDLLASATPEELAALEAGEIEEPLRAAS